MRKIAFFDFCDTLVNFQTADAFVDFVRKTEANFSMRFLNDLLYFLRKVKITVIFHKLFPDLAIEKRIKLLQLRGLTYAELNKLASLYYQELIRPNIIPPTVAEIQRLYQLGYEICLVSAGYSIIYSTLFQQKLHINKLGIFV
jgi:phosphoserine phosphatase